MVGFSRDVAVGGREVECVDLRWVVQCGENAHPIETRELKSATLCDTAMRMSGAHRENL